MKHSVRDAVAREFPFFMALPGVVWQALFFYVPLAIIIVASFLRADSQGVITGVTLSHYRELIALPFVRIIARSFGLALVTALSCLAVGYPVAYYLARKVVRAKNILLFLLMLPFWTNFLIQLYAWFFLLERHGAINTVLLRLHLISEPIQLMYTMFAVYLVMFYCYLPFMIMPIYSALEKIDPALLEGAADLGATAWQRFRSVTFPLSLNGVKTGIFLVFIPALSEFVVPALVGGARYLYIGSLISYYFLVARNLFLGAAFTCITGGVLCIGGIIAYWLLYRTSYR